MANAPIEPVDLMEYPPGEIAVQIPGATALFRAAGLDYCCAGRTTLKAAAADESLDIDRLVADILSLVPNAPTPGDQLETAALIDIIVERYHRTHSRELPELIELAQRVEQVHREHPLVPAGLSALLKQMLGELTIHMQKEELVLFPQMKKGDESQVEHPVKVMMAEHDDHGAMLRRVNDLTHDLRVPDDGCATWRALYGGLSKLSDDLIDHIHTENNILFPRFMAA